MIQGRSDKQVTWKKVANEQVSKQKRAINSKKQQTSVRNKIHQIKQPAPNSQFYLEHRFL